MKIKKRGLQIDASERSDRPGLDPLATLSTDSANRDFAVNTFICVLILILNVGGIAYVVTRGTVVTSAGEEFVITVLFLAAPFIGCCSAFRIAKLPNRSAKIIGSLLVAAFALFLVHAVMVDWAQYRYDQEILRR